MLEVNHNHKKADLRHLISSPTRTRISALGISLMMALGSGALPVSAMTPEKSNPLSAMFESDSDISLDTIVAIPPEYQGAVESRIYYEKDEYTVGDLLSLTSLSLPIYNESSSLDWLNYCINLEYLTLIIKAEDTDLLKDIEILPNLKTLDLYGTSDVSADAFSNQSSGKVNLSFLVYTASDTSADAFSNLSLDKDNFSFLKNGNLEKISLNGFDIEKGVLEELIPDIKTIIINSSTYGSCSNIIQTDFTKFKALEKLDFQTMMPYNIAVKFSSEDYQTLINQGTLITASEEGTIEEVIQINQKLDKIIKELSISKDATDKEKLDKILIYVLKNLKYSPEVKKASPNSPEYNALSQDFYTNGVLYSPLNEGTAICGNYAALVTALAYRVDLYSEILRSNDHAWNLVEVENQYYYVDATWLDTDKYFSTKEQVKEIKKGNGAQYDWYLEDPTNYPFYPHDAHEAINIPDFIEIKPIVESKSNDNNIQDITNDKFKIDIGGKELIIAGGALVGVLSALGGAIAINKNRKRKKYRRQRPYDFDYDDSYYRSRKSSNRRR